MVEFPVAFAELALHAARYAKGQHACGDVARHDAACADDRVVTDRDAGHDDDACAEPDVLADADGQVVLIAFLAQLRCQRMVRRRERDVRPDHRVVADEDLAVVDGREVVVGVDLLAEVQVMAAPVRVQRRLDVAVLPDFC